MNVKEILTKWLKDNGYDGLYSDFECGCALDDLCPCDGDITCCEPGYQIHSQEWDFLIVPEKPKDPQ
jgi:hypothetical protein